MKKKISEMVSHKRQDTTATVIPCLLCYFLFKISSPPGFEFLIFHTRTYERECTKKEPPTKVGDSCLVEHTQQINQLYSADDRNKTADLNPIRDLLDKRQELSDQIEQMEQEKTAIEQQVKLQMQDAAYGTAPGYKVSWVSSESKRVDSQRLQKEQPDIFNQYSKNVSSRRFTIVHAA